MSSDMEAHKRTAARRAADMVKSGMVVGLGTGSTATYMIERLGERVAEGLHIVGIPTSEDSARKAKKAGIPLTDFSAHRQLDIAIDGADEVQRGPLHLIKGLGGALLREKIVAQASKIFVVIVDGSKPVDHLGERAPVPVEVIPFGWECTAERLSACGAKGVKPRTDRDGNLFVSDNGNMILDCTFGPIEDPEDLARQIDAIVGVVEHGMFLNMASEVLVATEQGVERWEP
ncbi:ribose-5-phosphate isomerase RpiA [Gluconobacter cerinus]|uniref:Ribose-5-phosphate isomerase A n=3 Tax=Gluconobacter cerinus TaxID=38307 RepID=A0AAV5NEP9_9PROT|nr:MULTISPECIES: ribose-5-phosphate isomerase RpiA [Gluconobacter]MBS1017656.1 ribose-5-phosphate isomerase RpiA [Gluconobacter cerinus]MBS1024846.1 ribose-5-phosphate isomerase RpiA [Gluconobacter cerinus]MBS1030205.1 ribose-5-phosphate isomerase RpiA [Gluconobacter cerinus]MBS1039662.1 ribose-5-phosphate isomerase RpiA [Gluconobacter cerinus]MBS1044172.1 ribose-5-phosphate isomerase RpiA [Gluconobacter cerinus]